MPKVDTEAQQARDIEIVRWAIAQGASELASILQSNNDERVEIPKTEIIHALNMLASKFAGATDPASRAVIRNFAKRQALPHIGTALTLDEIEKLGLDS